MPPISVIPLTLSLSHRGRGEECETFPKRGKGEGGPYD